MMNVRFFCVSDRGVSVVKRPQFEPNPFEGAGYSVCGFLSEGLITLSEIAGQTATSLSQVLSAGVLQGIMEAYGAYYHTPPCIRTGMRTYRPRMWEGYLSGVAS